MHGRHIIIMCKKYSFHVFQTKPNKIEDMPLNNCLSGGMSTKPSILGGETYHKESLGNVQS